MVPLLLWCKGAFGKPSVLSSGALGACPTQFHGPHNKQQRTTRLLWEPLQFPLFQPHLHPPVQALSVILGTDSKVTCFASSLGPPFTLNGLPTFYPSASGALLSNIAWTCPDCLLQHPFPITHRWPPTASPEDIPVPPQVLRLIVGGNLAPRLTYLAHLVHLVHH